MGFFFTTFWITVSKESCISLSMKTLNLDVHFEFVKDEAVSLPRQNQEHGAGTYFSVMTFIQVLVLSHRPLELRAVTFEIWS